MTAKNFLGTILFGVAAGVAIGVLLSNDKNKITKKIMDKKHNLQEGIKDRIESQTEKFDDLAEMFESRIDDFKYKVDRLSERVQNKLS